MTLERMKEIKREKGITNEMIAAAAGLPAGTVAKVFGGITEHPRYRTLQALERFFSVLETGTAYADALPDGSGVRETAEPYEPIEEGPYTIRDYEALPDDRRTELIDGVFYDMDAPGLTHQRILGALYLAFSACMEEHPGECEVYLSPCDVQLDDRTIVEPDLMLVCGEHDRKGKRLMRAPDFAVEILSPSTRTKDLFIKTNKFASSGMREYWIIDPEKKRILVYDFRDGGAFPEICTYTFSDTVPVLISDGRCSIDFAVLKARFE